MQTTQQRLTNAVRIADVVGGARSASWSGVSCKATARAVVVRMAMSANTKRVHTES